MSYGNVTPRSNRGSRCGTVVALEAGHLVFDQPALPGDAVHDLHLRRRSVDGTQKPIAPGSRLFEEARVQQRVGTSVARNPIGTPHRLPARYAVPTAADASRR